MFIAKNNDLIILAKDTRAELEEALQFMQYTSIEETTDTYILINGEYKKADEAIIIAKQAKHNENTEKAYAYEKIGLFPYTAESIQTGEQVNIHIEFNVDNLSKFQGKLKGFDEGLYPTGKTTWLSNENVPIYVTEQDCKNILLLIDQYDGYLWETTYLGYETQIDTCVTVEQVEAIEIVYEDVTINADTTEEETT